MLCKIVARNLELLNWASIGFNACRGIWHNSTQHNEIHHNDIQRYDIQHNNTQRNDIQHSEIQPNDTQQNGILYEDKQSSMTSLLAKCFFYYSQEGNKIFSQIWIAFTVYFYILPTTKEEFLS